MPKFYYTFYVYNQKLASKLCYDKSVKIKVLDKRVQKFAKFLNSKRSGRRKRSRQKERGSPDFLWKRRKKYS